MWLTATCYNVSADNLGYSAEFRKSYSNARIGMIG
jgi:hypothetical protein